MMRPRAVLGAIVNKLRFLCFRAAMPGERVFLYESTESTTAAPTYPMLLAPLSHANTCSRHMPKKKAVTATLTVAGATAAGLAPAVFITTVTVEAAAAAAAVVAAVWTMAT